MNISKVLLFLFFCVFTIPPSSAWVSGYDYRMPIEINNTGDNLSYYQYNFTVNTTELVLANKMNANGSDCRITNKTDVLQSFWNETSFNNSSTKIWVNATKLGNVTNTTHYMYYGKSSVSSDSSGSDTFLFYEDFGERTPKVEFGLFTSVEYGNNSATKLSVAVSDFNIWEPDFVVSLGDFIDGGANKAEGLTNLSAIEAVYDDLTMDRHYVFGNHDLDLITKEDFFNTTGASEKYYSFDVGDYHFIVLDDMYNSTGYDLEEHGEVNPWRYINSTQVTWLENDLNDTSKKTVVFVEAHLYGKVSTQMIQNNATIRGILENSSKVLAVFSGHAGDNSKDTYNEIDYYSMYAMDLAATNAYSKIRIYADDSIYIEGVNTQSDYGFFTQVYWTLGANSSISNGVLSLNGVGHYASAMTSYSTPDNTISVVRVSLDNTNCRFYFVPYSESVPVSGSVNGMHYDIPLKSSLDYRLREDAANIISGGDGSGVGVGVFHTQELIKNGTTWFLKLDGSIEGSTSHAYSDSHPYYSLYAYNSLATGTTDVDYTYVRKYIVNEPTTTLRAEESAPIEAPIITLLSQIPSTIYKNSTGYLNISYGISHDSSGLNNTSVSFIYRNYDWDLSDSNHSIRPPTNNLASVWNFDGRILRGANRNETPGLNFENNDTITGGDTYTWSGLDENSTKLTIIPVNSTYTLVYINATVHCIMPQMWYLDRTDQQEATKTQLPIHKTSNVLVKFWNFEIFKGNYDFLGVGYTDTSLSSNPALYPSDANPVNFYYVNSSYDPATGGDPITSGYAVYMGSLNASGWVDHVYSRSNSNYVRGFIDNNYLHTVINTTNISYLYFTSNTPSSHPFYINMTNVASSTNVSFANTNTLWAGNTPPFTLQSYTPNIWFAFMKLNMSLDHKLYATDNNDLWGSSTMNRTNITQALFPPTTPVIDHFHFLGETDYDMDGVYYGNFSIGCGVSSDPDGGDVTHNLTLHYANNLTVVTIINNTFTDKDITHNGVYFDANFSSIPYYSQTDNYTLRLIATDDESETVTVWLGVNFSLDGSPTIISYSPNTPVSSAEGENQTFSITTNLPGNVTWYINSVEVFNETSVNTSSYSNSTALAGVYNMTVVTSNTNGSNSMTWDWTVTVVSRMPLSIFIMWSVIMCVGVIIGFMTTGLYGITSSLLTATIAYMNSKNIINGNVVQYFSGVSTSDTIVVGYRTIESLPMSYIYLFIAIVMVIVFIIHVKNEIQYNLEPDMDGDFFDE